MTSLRAPANRVSPDARQYWALRAGIGWLVVLLPIAAPMIISGFRLRFVLALSVAASLAVAHLVVMPLWRYRVHRWEISADAVSTLTGWLHQELRIAPIARVQTVDTKRGPLEQIFGLANVTVTTASAAGPLKIHGLARPVAERLVDELTARTGTGDAT